MCVTKSFVTFSFSWIRLRSSKEAKEAKRGDHCMRLVRPLLELDVTSPSEEIECSNFIACDNMHHPHLQRLPRPG